MFSALVPGNYIYILDKTDNIKFKIGEVDSTTIPQYTSDGNITMTLKVKIDGMVETFNNIPSSSSIVSYNNGKLVLAETKQQIQGEVESLLHNSKYVMEHIEEYKKQIIECEEVLKDLNPQFAKDKERDNTISQLSAEVSEVKGTLQQIVSLLSKKEGEGKVI